MAILGWVSPTVVGSAGAGYSLRRRRSGNYNCIFNINNNCVVTYPKSCSIGGGGNKLGVARGVKTRSQCSSSSLTSSPPWLTLPPTFEGAAGKHMIYNFYNLADDKVESFDSYLAPHDHHAKFVGSSHGWLALFNHDSGGGGEVFLSNPLRGRRISLPPLANLSDSCVNFRDDVISKLILSCDPEDKDEDDCHHVLTYGSRSRMAFCSLNKHIVDVDLKTVWQWNPTFSPYEDIVYPSSNNKNRKEQVLCTPQFQLDDQPPLFMYDKWDIVNPLVPAFVSLKFGSQGNCDM